MSVFTRPCRNKGCKRKHWYYYFRDGQGNRHRKAIPLARTRWQAQQAELKAKQDVFEGRYGRPTGEYDFVEFVKKEYLPWARENKRSWRHDEFRAETICESKHFKGKTFAQISPLSIEKFKSDRRKSTIKFKKMPDRRRSPASVNRELEVFSRIFSLAIKRKVWDTNPCREVALLPLDNKRNRYLKDEEEPRLMEAMKGRYAHLLPMVIVAVGTGMRKGDHFNLRKEKVDFQRNVILVPNSKTGKDYTVPMNEDVRKVMLKAVRDNPSSEYVFVNPRTGEPYVDLKNGFAGACDKAKIYNLHWHDLRHTFGTRLAEAGYSEAVIAELMGHTDPKTTRRYTHGTDRSKQQAVEAARLSRKESVHNLAPQAEQPRKLAAVNS